MYQSYFGLREHPFTITPDPGYLYLSAHHQEALAHLLYGTQEQGGFVQLTGEVGTGKTTLIRSLLEQQLDNIDVALCLNPRLTEWDLLASVCDELGVDYPRKSHSLKPILDALNQHLLASHVQGRQTVLIIDEAQQLSHDVLEQVRLLTNLETHKHKLLRIILVGQPELQQMLAHPDLRQLAQRITARYHLLPLNRTETGAYVNHRLRVAGNRAALFTPEALKAIYRWSQGVPRVINIICDRALLAAYVKNQSVVNRHLLNKAAAEVLHGSEQQELNIKRGRLTLAAMAGLLLAVALALKPNELGPDYPDKPEISRLIDTKAITKQEELSLAPDIETTIAKLDGNSIDDYKESLFETSTNVEETKPKADLVTEDIQTDTQALPNVSMPEMPLGQRLLVESPGENNSAVMQHLLQLWRLSLPKITAQKEDFCDSELLLEVKLRCLAGQADLGELRAYNRPAIVVLTDDTNRRHELLLTSIDATTVTLEFNEQTAVVESDQFDSYWTGEYLLLWRTPVEESLLRPGSQGQGVIWLRNRIALVDFIVEPINAVFDNSLRERVRQFQSSRGLQVAGLVGSRTLLLLDNLAPAPGTPLLRNLPAALTGTGD